MKLIKARLVLKTNDLILFANIYNNKRCKENSYKLKISFLAVLHVHSTKKLLLIPFIKSTVSTVFYGSKIYKKLSDTVVTFNSISYYSIKFNNNFYSTASIKNSYSFSYYQVQKFLYRNVGNIVKKLVKIM